METLAVFLFFFFLLLRNYLVTFQRVSYDLSFALGSLLWQPIYESSVVRILRTFLYYTKQPRLGDETKCIELRKRQKAWGRLQQAYRRCGKEAHNTTYNFTHPRHPRLLFANDAAQPRFLSFLWSLPDSVSAAINFHPPLLKETVDNNDSFVFFSFPRGGSELRCH